MSKIKYRTKEFIEKSETLTIKEAGQVLGVSETLMRLMIDRGELPIVQLGRLVRISRVDLDEFLRGKKRPKKPKQPKQPK